MQSFIVLGIIPGTNIQTTLNFWLGVTCLLVLLAVRKQLKAGRSFLQRQLVALRIAHAIDSYELNTLAL